MRDALNTSMCSRWKLREVIADTQCRPAPMCRSKVELVEKFADADYRD
jgi:hypothetical protein